MNCFDLGVEGWIHVSLIVTFQRRKLLLFFVKYPKHCCESVVRNSFWYELSIFRKAIPCAFSRTKRTIYISTVLQFHAPSYADSKIVSWRFSLISGVVTLFGRFHVNRRVFFHWPRLISNVNFLISENWSRVSKILEWMSVLNLLLRKNLSLQNTACFSFLTS